MRFEAKHQELKSYATISKNFKNICLTVASRVQMKQACYLFAENFLKPELEIKVASKNCCLEKDITQWVSIQGIKVDDFEICQSIKISGVDYQKHMAVVMNGDNKNDLTLV